MEFPVIDLKATGNHMRHLCRKNKIKPSDIQRELRLSCVQTVYKWFKGDNVPSIENFYALSLLLGVSMEELLVLKKPGRDRRNLAFSMLLETYADNLERVIIYYKKLNNMQAMS